MMKSKELEKYLNDIIDRGVKVDYWFMTKQTVSDFFLELFIAQIVDRFQLSDKKYGFAHFYSEQFKQNDAMAKKYPKQMGENTYRNAIIAEYLGLIKRSGSTYDTAEVTEAYELISKFIKTYEDMEIYHKLVERQLEKLTFNVLDVNHRGNNYKDISIFAIMLLYKIMYELYNVCGSSYLSYNEFILFVMRTKKYSDWNNCLELILLSRKEDKFDESSYIEKIVNQRYVNDIRFDALFNELSNIKYIKKLSFEIVNNQAITYIKNTLEKFENSRYYEITDKGVMKEFLCSSNYFEGSLIDNLELLNVDNSSLIDKYDESIVEDIINQEVKKNDPTKVKNIEDSTSIDIIEFPIEFKTNKVKNSSPIVRLYNFEKINKSNTKKGNKAEELVFEYEKLRLAKLGYNNLIDKIEHVSKTKGDGLGYDILSYDIVDENIVPIYIEVKGTTMDERSPFDISKNELEVASTHGKNYRIYRVSSLGDAVAKCFIIDGEEMFEKFEFEPMSFKAFKKETNKTDKNN